MLTRREIIIPHLLTGAIVIPLTCMVHSDEPTIIPFVAIREFLVFLAVSIPMLVASLKMASGSRDARSLTMLVITGMATGFAISVGSTWMASHLYLGHASSSIVLLYILPFSYVTQKYIRRSGLAQNKDAERAH